MVPEMMQGLAPIGDSRGICYDFLKGMCSRGDSCRFSHSLDRGGLGGSAAQQHYTAAAVTAFSAVQSDPVLAGHAIDAGHEYIRGDNGAFEVDVELVNVMIADRVGLKLGKNFAEADQVKEV